MRSVASKRPYMMDARSLPGPDKNGQIFSLLMRPVAGCRAHTRPVDGVDQRLQNRNLVLLSGRSRSGHFVYCRSHLRTEDGITVGKINGRTAWSNTRLWNSSLLTVLRERGRKNPDGLCRTRRSGGWIVCGGTEGSRVCEDVSDAKTR